jgi:hypothetical protein
MNKRTYAVFFVFATLLLAQAGRAQVVAYQSPFDVPTDPRGVGMGESLVALPSNPSALMYNPAGLASLQGAGVSYGERPLNWTQITADMFFFGWSAFAATPVGVFSARYDRFSLGEFPITSIDLTGNGTERIYYHDVVLGYGRKIAGWCEAGIAARYYSPVNEVVHWSGPPTAPPVPDMTPAWLFDLGVLLNAPPLLPAGEVEDRITFGLAVRNVGSKVGYKFPGESQTSSDALPQYLHAGIAATARLKPGEAAEHCPVAATWTLEYTNVLNSTPGGQGGNASWRSGVEIVLAEILSFRGGLVVQNLTNVYGEEGKAAFRYGAGLAVPLSRLGVPLPVVLNAEYSAILLHDVGILFFSPQRHVLDTFSFGMNIQ